MACRLALPADEKRANRREYRLRYYAANRERVLARNKEWRAKTNYVEPKTEVTEERRARKKETARQWRLQNPEKHKAYNRAWVARNADRLREYNRAYYRRNFEKLHDRWRVYYAKNREHLRAYQREYSRRVVRISKSIPYYEELRKAALLKNGFYAAADRVIARGLPPFMRADVISMIVLDAIEGKLTVDGIPAAARSYVSRYYRECGAFGTSSLDDNIPGTDLKGIDAIVYEGAGVGFDDGEFSMTTDEDDAAFVDEMVD